LRPVRATDHLPYAVGASLGFRRRVWEALGGFDESFLIGGDEVDFCWRAQDAGYELGAASDAVTYYRSKRRLRAYFVQQYRYQLGSAQVRAKHTALGRLETVPRSLQLRTIVRRAKAVVRVDRLLRRETRRTYLRRVAVFAGSVAGYARFRAVA
jgi:GT2 family glycosyltransferase